MTRKAKEAKMSATKKNAQQVKTPSRSRALVWLADYWLTMGIIADTAAGSFSHLQHLAAKNGQHGFTSDTSALIFDALAIHFQQEIQRDKRDNVAGKKRLVPVFGLMGSLGFTVAANFATAMHTPWGIVFGIASPVVLMIIVYCRDRRARILRDQASTGDGKASTGTNVAMAAVSTASGAAASTGPKVASTVASTAASTSTGEAPSTGTAAKPAGSGVVGSRESDPRWDKRAKALIPSGYKIENLMTADHEVAHVRKAKDAFLELNPGQSFTADRLRIMCGRSKGWACQMLAEIKRQDEATTATPAGKAATA
jgi:hypothetical protein